MDTAPTSLQPPIFTTGDTNFAAWLIAESKLKFCGVHPNPRRQGLLVFDFEDPDRIAPTFGSEFLSGSCMVNVRQFLRSRDMLLDLIQGRKRGGFDEHTSR